MDIETTPTENKTLEFAKDTALDFVTTAASSAGVVAGVLGVTYVYTKFAHRSKSRHSKKNPQPES